MAYSALFRSAHRQEVESSLYRIWRGGGGFNASGPIARFVQVWPWEVMTSSTSPPAKLICYILKDAPTMEPPMKVTLVSGLVAWTHTPQQGTRKHIQMRITCTQMHTSAVRACKYCTHFSHVTWRFMNAVMVNRCSRRNYVKLDVKPLCKHQLFTHMPAAGVAARWRLKGQIASSNLTLNNAGFLLCGQHTKLTFSTGNVGLSQWCEVVLLTSGEHPAAPHPAGVGSTPRSGVLSTSELLLPWTDCELPVMLTCVTVSVYMSILALLSVSTRPWARHVQPLQWSWSAKSDRLVKLLWMSKMSGKQSICA